MTTPIPSLPQPGPLGRASGTIPGSLDSLPGDKAPPPSERLSSAEIVVLANEIDRDAGNFLGYVEAREAEIIEAAKRAQETWSERTDLPVEMRTNLARIESAPFRKKTAAVTEATRDAMLADLRAKLDRLLAQRPHYKSAAHILQSYSWTREGVALIPALAGQPPAAVMNAFNVSYSEKNVHLAAVVLARVAQMTDDEFGGLTAMGFDRKLLAEHIVGSHFIEARDSFRKAEIAWDAALAADRRFRSGKDDGAASIAIGLRQAGHHNDGM